VNIFKYIQVLCAIFCLFFVSTIYGQSKNTQNLKQDVLVDIIVFSYDRPMQLDAYLKSLQTYASGNYAVYVLYRASNDDFEWAYQTVKQEYTQALFIRQTVDEQASQERDNKTKKNKNNHKLSKTSHKNTQEDFNDFKDWTLKLSFQVSRAPYIMYAVDDIIVTDFFHLPDCIEAMEQEQAYGFYLRMGKNITQCYTKGHNTDHALPTLQVTKKGFISWQFNTGILEWAYPHTLDMAIYRKSDIEESVKSVRFKSPNTLEAFWDHTADRSKKGLAYCQSKVVNIPVNMVQEDGHTPHMKSYSKYELLDLFNNNMRIDIAPLHRIENKAPHMDYMLTFKQYERYKSARQLGFTHNETMRPLWDLLKHKPIKKNINFVIVIPSYNNAQWYKRNLDSVFAQNYKNFTVIYLDDCSPDGTGKLVEAYVTEKNKQDVVTVIKNPERIGALANIYNAVHMCSDEKVIISLDGDDLFAHENVLDLLNILYQNKKIWVTYGSDVRWPTFQTTACKEIPQHIIDTENFRQYPFTAGPTRTFYAWLFKKIEKQDLQINNRFFDICSDLAIMLPMLEMAGNRIQFVPDITYIYNIGTGINDWKIKAEHQRQITKIITEQRSYRKLDHNDVSERYISLEKEHKKTDKVWYMSNKKTDQKKADKKVVLACNSTRLDSKKPDTSKKKIVIKNAIDKDILISEIIDYTPKTMREIIVVIPSYNNKNYYEANLDSLIMQKYENWRAIYIDDKSPDGTGELVKEYIKKHNLEHKIILIQNQERCGALANLYTTIHACPDSAIIATLDGDDRFAHENVLSQVNKVYDYFNVLMTYGCYIDSSNYTTSCCADYPQEVVQANSFRKHRWITSHLRTFYAGLFNRIKKEDLTRNGQFFPVAWDLAIMFPMLEMAGERYKFIPEVLYIYNNENPLADHRQSRKIQDDLSDYIRNLEPYQRLTGLFV